jgi:hypothetical protein
VQEKAFSGQLSAISKNKRYKALVGGVAIAVKVCCRKFFPQLLR